MYLISPVCSGILSVTQAANDLIQQEAEEIVRKEKAASNKDKKVQCILFM